jgi:phospholipase/carboxylesterase
VREIVSLEYLESPSPGLSSGSRSADRTSLLGCLLHGFGASAEDLLPLGPEIDQRRHWLAPQAPAMITAGGSAFGRAWFPRDPALLERALYGGYFEKLRSMEPPELAIAAREVRRFLAARGTDWKHLVVAGFSQGAMVAAELLRQGILEGEPIPAATVLLSGALIAERWWREASETPTDRAVAGSAPRVFIAHGREDAMLPFGDGEALREVLSGAGFSVTWHPFTGGHAIPQEIILAVRTFLGS